MNLINAYKKGRYIRRKGRTTWIGKPSYMCTGSYYHCDSSLGEWLDKDFYLAWIGPDEEDLLATDWEVRKR